MKRYVIVLALCAAFSSAPAFAKCADEVKALQGKAAGKDAATKPGQQQESFTATAPQSGGGAESASAKILEAQAQDQKGDEAACMKAVEEAKALMAK